MTTQMDATMNERQGRAGIVLCGGRSSRMGRPKSDLVFGNQTLLQRVVGQLSTMVGEMVVVAAAEQPVPPLSEGVILVRDRLAFAGPLAGIAVGLAALNSSIEAAFVTSCDVPCLHLDFVEALFSRLAGYDVVVPFDEQHYYPLAAVYRGSLAVTMTACVTAGMRRPRDFFEHVATRKLNTKILAAFDPDLRTLTNLNTPEDYRQALIRAGLPIPAWVDPKSV